MTKINPSAAALRMRKMRQRRRIIVSGGEDARQLIQGLATRTNAGETMVSALVAILADQPDPVAGRLKALVSIGHRVQGLTGWRKYLAHFMGLI
ncbi:MAG: hypothetical protein ACYCTW_12630 [Sulfuricella sp.]